MHIKSVPLLAALILFVLLGPCIDSSVCCVYLIQRLRTCLSSVLLVTYVMKKDVLPKKAEICILVLLPYFLVSLGTGR